MELFPCAIIVAAIATFVLKVDAEVTVTTTSPVNPVKEDGILSIHCQVRGLETGQSISLSRQLKGTSQPTRISWDYDIVLTVVEERLFLAYRQLEDGTLVYFLSILHPNLKDEGVYSCTAISATLEVIAADSVEVSIEHFPNEPYPLCGSKTGGLQVELGDVMPMYCLSQVGNPQITMRWRRTGKSGHIPTAVSSQNVINGTARSVLRYEPTVQDNGAVFLCEITSRAFPSEIRTCHVGPLVVTKNGRVVKEPHPRPTSTNVVSVKNRVPNSPPGGVPTVKHPSTFGDGCHEACSPFDGPILYWVIATLFAGMIALTLLIVIIFFAIKLHRRTTCLEEGRAATNSRFVTPIPRDDDAYEKLEYRRVNNNRTYMELQRNCLLQKHVPPIEVELKHGQYVVTSPMPCNTGTVNT